MENDDMVRRVYESIICSLTLQIADLKINLMQAEKKYEDLDSRYNSLYVRSTKKFDVMEAQNIASQEQKDIEMLLNRHLADDFELEFTLRTLNCLKGEAIYYVGDLVKLKEEDILKIPNMGRKSLKELEEFLEKYSLSFNMNIPWWVRPDF